MWMVLVETGANRDCVDKGLRVENAICNTLYRCTEPGLLRSRFMLNTR